MRSIKYTGSLLAVLLLLLGGCTKENLGNSGGVNSPVPEGDGFISLSINAATTRGAVMAGTEQENNINAVRVILYDKPADGIEPTVQYAFHFNITTNPTPDGYDYFLGDGLYVNGIYTPDDVLYFDPPRTSEDMFITFAQSVERQDYQILVIINPTFEATETEEADPLLTVADMENADYYEERDINVYARTKCGEPLSAMKELLLPDRKQILNRGGLADIASFDGRGNFLMTNEQELFQISAADIPSTRDQAHASPYNVSVDRVVAKIIVGHEPADLITTPEGAIFCNVEYVVDHQNKMTYWWRHMAWLRNSYDSQMERHGDGSDRGDRYAFAPNFNGLVDLNNGSNYASRYTENYDFYLPNNMPYCYPGSLDEDDFEELGAVDVDGISKYVLENTVCPENYAAGERYYTRVLIRGNYVPEGLTDEDTYYIYNNMVITQAQMDDYVAQAVEIAGQSGALVEDGAGNYMLDRFPRTHAGEPEGMPGLFRALFLIIYDGLLSEPYPTSVYLDGSAAFEATDGYGLAAYPNGVSYYSVPIKHFGGTGGGIEDYGYYGVVRNNVYTITIKSVSGPGSPTPVGSSSHISAGMKITPWGRVGREINIGEEKPVFAYVRYEYYMEDNPAAVKIDYDYSLPVGAAIPTNQAVLNRYKTYVNSLGQGTFGNGQLVSGSATQVAAGANVVKVIYSTGMERSATPEISTPVENATWAIVGRGVPGATIALTAKGILVASSIFVEEDGKWGVFFVPFLEALVAGDEVSAIQTEPGKLESERVYAIVIPPN